MKIYFRLKIVKPRNDNDIIVCFKKVIIIIIFNPLLIYLATEKNNNNKMDLADPKSENEVEQETIFNIISAYGM